MGYIGNEPTTGHFPVDNFTSSGGSTYTLAKAPASAGAIEVSVQGVLQPTTAYTVSGTTLTMAGVTSGVKIFVRHLGETLSLPTPADGSVTATKLAVNAVDGTKIAMGSDAQGDILYHGASDYTRLAKGTAGQVLKMNSGATAPEWGTDVGGKIVQVVNVTDGSVATGTTTFGTVDANAITKTEGTEFMTLAITPTSVSNKLIIRVQAFMTSDTTGKWLIGGLFQDTTTNALASALPFYCPTDTPPTVGIACIIHHYMAAGTTSATTFKFRGGTDNAATTTFNGQSGAVRYAGTLSSSMTITEIAV